METYNNLPRELKREVVSHLGDNVRFETLLDSDPSLLKVFNKDQLDVLKLLAVAANNKMYQATNTIRKLINLANYFRSNRNNVISMGKYGNVEVPNIKGAAIVVEGIDGYNIMNVDGQVLYMHDDNKIYMHTPPFNVNPIDLVTKSKVNISNGYAVYFPRKLIELIDAELIYNYILKLV